MVPIIQAQDLRKLIKKSLSEVTIEQRMMDSKRMVQLIESFLQRDQSWGVFQPLTLEPQIQDLWESHPNSNLVNWFFPRVEGNHLKFHQKPNEWQKGSFGILEPSTESPEVRLEDLTGLLIPAVALSYQGDRLGHGKGFYDRALEGFQGVKVGVAFAIQVMELNWNVNPWDQKMDYVLCEKGFFKTPFSSF